MEYFQYVSYVFGAFMIVGAFMGLKAGSKISLLAGLVSGALALLSGYLFNSNGIMAIRLLIVVSGVLSIVFFFRFSKTKKFMPSGMLEIVSLGVLFYCCFVVAKL